MAQQVVTMQDMNATQEGNSMNGNDTAARLRVAAEQLEQCAARQRAEARWIEDNWPLTTWSTETSTNYLRAAHAQATVDIENTARRVVVPLERKAAANA